MIKLRTMLSAALFVAVTSILAVAAPGTTTLFSSNNGDVVFPFTPPPRLVSPSTPGNIDNMVIGAGTPAAGTFTNLNASSVNSSGFSTYTQPAPTAKTVSSTMTAAQLQSQIITVLQGAGAASAQQLPLATAMDTAMPTAVANTAFEFSMINISTTAAEAASITTNTGWTLVGDMDVQANNAATTKSAGRFLARKTGTGAWVLYRLS